MDNLFSCLISEIRAAYKNIELKYEIFREQGCYWNRVVLKRPFVWALRKYFCYRKCFVVLTTVCHYKIEWYKTRLYRSFLVSCNILN